MITPDDLTRRGWHNARRIDGETIAADSEADEPAYSISISPRRTIVTREMRRGVYQPVTLPPIATAPTPEQAAGWHEDASCK